MYPVGAALPLCRLLTLDYAAKAFTLTLRSHLLGLRGPGALPSPGLVVEAAVVLRVDPKQGLLLGVPAAAAAASSAATVAAEGGGDDKKAAKKATKDEGASGGGGLVGCYVPIARVATAAERGVDAASKKKKGGGDDEDGDGGATTGVVKGERWKLEKHFAVGDAVRVRVVAANLMEGVAIGTAIAAQVDASVLSARELAPGQMHKCPILAVDSYGVLLDLGGSGAGARALVTTMHLADATVSDPKKRFRVGAKVTCRLLTCEKGGTKVHATMKKALVADSEPPLLSYAQVRGPM